MWWVEAPGQGYKQKVFRELSQNGTLGKAESWGNNKSSRLVLQPLLTYICIIHPQNKRNTRKITEERKIHPFNLQTLLSGIIFYPTKKIFHLPPSLD